MRPGHYKEAIDTFKQLIRKDPQDQWKHCLAESYSGRARELAGKNLYREAFAILENGEALQGETQVPILKINCLIAAGEFEKALATFDAARNSLRKNEIDQVEMTFALVVTSGHEELLQGLSEDSKLKRHYSTVQAAIEAYCRGDGEKLSENLTAIPFRSPYRHLRFILSALSTGSNNPGLAVDALARVSADSPFKRAAEISQSAIEAGFPTDTLKDAKDEARAFIIAVSGIDKQSAELIARISKTDGSAKALFNALVSYCPPDDKGITQSLCFRLLPNFPPGVKAYQKRFGNLSGFDLHRVGALAFEKRENYASALIEWKASMDRLEDSFGSERNSLIRALLLRRAANCADLEYGKYSAEAVDLLEESLDSDPKDLPTYRYLFTSYQTIEDTEAYRRCVERALEHCPEESEILMAAIELAIARNTFKKATNLANRLLRLDPINKRARLLLINAHLAHAGKQMMIHRFDLAAREIDEAKNMERPGSPSGLIPLFSGLLGYFQKNERHAEGCIEEACRIFGGYHRGYFRTVMEMTRLNSLSKYRKKYTALLKRISSDKPDTSVVLGLIEDIQHYAADSEYSLTASVTALRKYFAQAASLDFGWEQTELICDTLQKIESFQNLNDFADEAVRRWPDHPIFVYFQVYATTRGIPAHLSPTDAMRLQQAAETAMEKDDIRISTRIMEFLEPCRGFLPSFNPQQFEEGLDNLLDLIPDEILNKILFGEDDRNEKPAHRRKPGKSDRDPFTLDLFND